MTHRSTYRLAYDFATDVQDWRGRAACRDADPRLFDGDRAGEGRGQETGHERDRRIALARRVYCAACPVWDACKADAERHSDWGTLRAGEVQDVRPGSGVAASKLSQIRSMARRRYSDRDIGKAVGMDSRSVQRVRQRFGIPPGVPPSRPGSVVRELPNLPRTE